MISDHDRDVAMIGRPLTVYGNDEASSASTGKLSGPVDESYDRWYAGQRHQLSNEQACRLIWRRGWGACASLYGESYQREEDRADKAEAA
ncbi:MAG TPA: hypothetical protein VF389_00935, partial [Woeseiaceae bacterium]